MSTKGAAARDGTLLAAYCALITWLSDQSSLPPLDPFSHLDKIIHGGAYLLMAWLAWRCLSHAASGAAGRAWASLFFCSAFGLFDEFHQALVPGRIADAFDWGADTLGASAAVALLYVCEKRSQRHPQGTRTSPLATPSE